MTSISSTSVLALALSGILVCSPALAQSTVAPTAVTTSPKAPPLDTTRLSSVLNDAARLSPLETVVVARNREIVAERGYRSNKTTDSTNIKSASKTIISAMVGIAIEKGLLTGVDQPIAPILSRDLPANPDPRLAKITIGNLLSMQAGLDRMSGPNYGRWVSSGNWVRFALAADFVDEPGGQMLYSTGSTHLLSAILTKVGGKSTLALAREWFAPVEGFRIGAWERDPQGVYLGGNQMAMSARSLLAFGELYRNGGRTPDGRQVVPENWVTQSWTERTQSRFSGDGYGYGWFTREIGGHRVHFAWGFGGQMLYIMPDLKMSVAMTSNEGAPSARTGYRDDLHDLLARIISTAGA
ncbi:CubicO group peptidase (beta-lactamase class C family) [Rhizobium sp. PP-F2F-G38]|nr:CubicO group peptidase (beta-lactamase class C family) [Rhizobium sp. PP-WC-1G-195]PYE98296.1 CubicO group peptidase (beta-lactamase class C family) [Rhizobium sp. PP-F2F-G38]